MMLLEDRVLCEWCSHYNLWRCAQCDAHRKEFNVAMVRIEWHGFWLSIKNAVTYGPHGAFADWLDESGFPLLSELMREVVRNSDPELKDLRRASADG